MAHADGENSLSERAGVWGQKLEMRGRPGRRHPLTIAPPQPACRRLIDDIGQLPRRVRSAGREVTDDRVCCAHHVGKLLGRRLK
jgi:hypothetical protein